ncbi:MAG: phosphatase PAP2 family protein [Chlorobiaceae bacterium]|nr:phosphatase PAP2 family protein [Chlorobiaceae bacterium]
MTIPSFDSAIVTGLDAFLSGEGTGNRLFRIFIYNIGENPLFRGFPIFFTLLLFWFGNTSIESRSRILTGLMATCIAVFISVSMQYLFHIHTRPVLDPSLHLHIQATNWDHQSSFPSDTAMLYFSLSTLLFLLNRRVGALVFTWSIISAGLCRVALGWHYPSDILGSLIIAPALVFLFTKPEFLRKRIERVLEALQEKMHVVNALLMLFIAEAYTLFPGLRGIFETLVHLLRQNLDIPD